MIEALLIAKTYSPNSAVNAELRLLPALANRHGLITGATGTGKTVTLQRLAEQFSNIGVPVFMADVKGDLSGMAAPGKPSSAIAQRLQTLGLEAPEWRGAPVVFWDVYGKSGHPVRATVSELGPLLLGRMLNLNETQQGVLTAVFKMADDHGLLLLDLKDLRAILQHAGDNASEFKTQYGNMSTASIGAIQRGLLQLEQQGAEAFFSEPVLDIADLMKTDGDGRGVVNILAADQLMNSPKLYSTFLLWMLAELFEDLPEVGDVDKPKLVFFFDEAHLLFNEAPKPLLEKIEQVVRLIRSKGVGIYFVTQNPLDIPDTVLGQLGNRVQHALRAFTPRDQKAVKTAAETLRPNPAFDAASIITELGVGEALVSFLDEKGRPNVVERAYIVPPASQLGALPAQERERVVRESVLYGHYEKQIDRESAYEVLQSRAHERAPADAPPARSTGKSAPSRDNNSSEKSAADSGWLDGLGGILGGTTGPRGGHREGAVEAAAKSAARSIGSQIGREIVRGVLGSMFGRRR